MTADLLERLSDILDMPADVHPDLGHVFDALDGARIRVTDRFDEDEGRPGCILARWTPPETLTEDSDPPLQPPLPLARWDENCRAEARWAEDSERDLEIGGVTVRLFTDADLQEGVPFVVDLTDGRTMLYDGDAWGEVDPDDRDAVIGHVRANCGTGPTLPRLDGRRAR